MARTLVDQQRAAVKIQAVFRGYYVRRKIVDKVREDYTNILMELNDDSISSLWWTYNGLCEPNNSEKKVSLPQIPTPPPEPEKEVAILADPPSEQVEFQSHATPSVQLPQQSPQEPIEAPNAVEQAVTTEVKLPIPPPPVQPQPLQALDLKERVAVESRKSNKTSTPATPPKLPPSRLDKHPTNSYRESEETLKEIKEARRLHLEEELKWANQAIKNRKDHLNMMKRLKKLNLAT